MSQKKRVLSGITSSGKITLGNYLGAIKNFIVLQDDNELLVFIANLHALTNPIAKASLEQNTIDIAAWYLACGLDPEKAIIFIQSDVFEHTQLGYILLCHSYLGELERMTQFKDKLKKSNQQNNTISIPSGLLIYPTLMAADILLYDAELVPVGNDQIQHLELTRDLAKRLNKKYQKQLFTIPQPYQNSNGNRIMALQEPTNKMSKSDTNIDNIIYLNDSEKTIAKKIKKAVTDSENIIKYDKINKPGISNLLNIYATINNITLAYCESFFQDKSYGELKTAVIDAINNALKPIQEKYYYYKKNEKEVLAILKNGAAKAKAIANKKYQIVATTIGLNHFDLPKK